MKRIGILTSGGDCQALNAALRGVARALFERYGKDVKIFGIHNGYRGLIEGDYKEMVPRDFSGILTLGGTILGTSRQPFKLMRVTDENGVDKVTKMKATYAKMKLDCLVVLGGNGTQKTANLLSQEGLNVVALPKTIDNDLWGTEMTFGFQSAVEIATNVLDCIHTTATSHGRVFIVEVMGHKVGWLTLYAGIASGADVILLPEIPYDIDKVVKTIRGRLKEGKNFTILAVAEGALSVAESKLTKKEFKVARAQMTDPSIAYRVASEISEKTGQEVRVMVPGHIQRGGSPCGYDRVLSSRLGTAAAKLIEQGNFGNMVALQNGKIVPVPLSEIAGKLKSVDLDSDIVQCARDLGICLGD
nr:ATP-dependent 6-phosphofructokinase [Maliibacterium massiliense]